MGLLDSYFDKKEAPESEDTAETETEEIPTNELVDEEERSAARGDEVIGVVGPELKQGLEQVHGEEPVIQGKNSPSLIFKHPILMFWFSNTTLFRSTLRPHPKHKDHKVQSVEVHARSRTACHQAVDEQGLPSLDQPRSYRLPPGSGLPCSSICRN